MNGDTDEDIAAKPAIIGAWHLKLAIWSLALGSLVVYCTFPGRWIFACASHCAGLWCLHMVIAATGAASDISMKTVCRSIWKSHPILPKALPTHNPGHSTAEICIGKDYTFPLCTQSAGIDPDWQVKAIWPSFVTHMAFSPVTKLIQSARPWTRGRRKWGVQTKSIFRTAQCIFSLGKWYLLLVWNWPEAGQSTTGQSTTLMKNYKIMLSEILHIYL